MSALLAGRSALAVFPTGGGKTLCYQLPALLLDGLTLVVSPLIALMKDQVDALTARGIAAARLDSTLGADAQARCWRNACRAREAALRRARAAGQRRFRERWRGLELALVAIDEAHCISEWGHNFRPDYLKLARLCRVAAVRRVLALDRDRHPRGGADIRSGLRDRGARSRADSASTGRTSSCASPPVAAAEREKAPAGAPGGIRRRGGRLRHPAGDRRGGRDASSSATASPPGPITPACRDEVPRGGAGGSSWPASCA